MTYDLAIVGLGYWGPNTLRIFMSTSGCSVRYCCDLDLKRLSDVRKQFPHILTTTDFEDILSDSSIDGVVLATPTSTHFGLAKKAILAGKDVLIEKPMTNNSKEAKELVALAEKNKRIIMVDHVVLFSPAVVKLKELIDKGEIGDVLYIDTARTNLGLFQKDSNVIFDLATHEFSMLQYFLKNKPKIISVTGKSHFTKHPDVIYISAKYPQDILVHVHVSWLSPLKMRRMIIVGSKKMIVYDDIESSEKIKVYDKGVTIEKSADEQHQIRINYRAGDIWIPNIDQKEPLSLMAQHFIDSMQRRKVERSSGNLGAEIVEILENCTSYYNRKNNGRKKG
ncbi:MAG: Gfo/Idh/MocA family oxidoreductase [bacterium]